MKLRYILYTLLCAFVAFGCSDDDSTEYYSGLITVDKTGFVISDQEYGASFFSTYTTTDNIISVEVSEYPLGWEVEVTFDEDELEGEVYITAPDKYYAGTEFSGDIKIKGSTEEGNSSFGTIYVAMVEFINLEEQGMQANSFIVDQPGKVYLFNPNRRGESEAIATTKASDCELTWRTQGSPIGHVSMYDNMIGFYTTPDTLDLDDDDEEDDLIPGNAVISALASDGTILWSWHIWVTENEIKEVNLNGVDFMNYNLGALNNSNDDDEEILESYGLYYQWGRKDPFIYSAYYNASGSTDAMLYVEGDYTYQSYPVANNSNANISYTTSHPKNFVCGTENSNYDWLYAGRHNDSLWGSGSAEKSIYDPSPKGWRVPSSDDLAALQSLSAVAIAESEYGSITNGYAAQIGSELFMALGQRIFVDGTIQNFAPNSYSPWAGYYWSRDAASDGSNGSKQATAFRFYLDGVSDDSVTVETTYTDVRSTGMQIRCVKM